jgi:hypothetical protein
VEELAATCGFSSSELMRRPFLQSIYLLFAFGAARHKQKL